MKRTRVEIAEHILPGHPDKLCDAAVDALLDVVRQVDPQGHWYLKAPCMFDTFHLRHTADLHGVC